MSVSRISTAWHSCVLSPAQACSTDDAIYEPEIDMVSKYMSRERADREISNEREVVAKLESIDMCFEDYFVPIEKSCVPLDVESALSMCTIRNHTERTENMEMQIKRKRMRYTLDQYVKDSGNDRRAQTDMGGALIILITGLGALTAPDEESSAGLVYKDFDNLRNVGVVETHHGISLKLFDLDKLAYVYADEEHDRRRARNTASNDVYKPEEVKRSWVEDGYALQLREDLVDHAMGGVRFVGGTCSDLIAAIRARLDALDAEAEGERHAKRAKA